MIRPTRSLPRLLGACACAALLAACSSEPSEQEIRTALDAWFKTQAEASGKAVESLFGKKAAEGARKMTQAMSPELKSARKIACQKASDGAGHACDFEALVAVPFAGEQKQNLSGRFVKGDGGWVFMGPSAK